MEKQSTETFYVTVAACFDGTVVQVCSWHTAVVLTYWNNEHQYTQVISGTGFKRQMIQPTVSKHWRKSGPRTKLQSHQVQLQCCLSDERGRPPRIIHVILLGTKAPVNEHCNKS